MANSTVHERVEIENQYWVSFEIFVGWSYDDKPWKWVVEKMQILVFLVTSKVVNIAKYLNPIQGLGKQAPTKSDGFF